MTQILRFEMNVPAEVALKDSGPGKPIEGRYGNRVMYTLADDRVMYVAPIVASRISDLGIQPGELFQVCKQVRKQGTKRLIQWDVQRLTSEAETQLEHELRESIEVAQLVRVAQHPKVSLEPNPQPAPATQEHEQATPVTASQIPHVITELNGNVEESPCFTAISNAHPVAIKPENVPNLEMSTHCDAGAELGNGQNQPVPCTPTPVPATISTSNSSASGSSSVAPKNGNNSPAVLTKLEHALKTAISAAYNAEKYGADLGYVVRFDADAIKSMAITVLINMSDGNRR